MNLLSSLQTEAEAASVGCQTLNSLVCIRSQPYPALGGSPLRNLQTLNALKQLGSVSLFSLYKGPQNPASYEGLNTWQHGDLNQPQRSLQEKIRNRLRWLRPDGHCYTDWIHSAHNAQKFARFIEEVEPKLILFAELWLSPYLSIAADYRERNPDCKIIMDNHNVEVLLAQTSYQCSQGQPLKERVDLALDRERVRRMEAKALAQADQMWVCSEVDADMMRSLYITQSTQQCLDNKIEVIPNCVALSEEKDRPALSKQTLRNALSGSTLGPKILFLGSFGYGPNEEAARILIEEIYPQIQQSHPNAQLMLVGRGPTAWMQVVAEQNPNITVTGQVDSVQPYLQNADVMVVPLRHGSGTRLKLLESFAAGLPVISTGKGAEGLAVVDGQHLLLRDHSSEIATAVAQVLSSPALRQRLVEAAYELVQSEYSWVAATRKISQAINRLGLSAGSLQSAA